MRRCGPGSSPRPTPPTTTSSASPLSPPASNLSALAGNLNTVPGGALFASYIVAAYTGTYPDVQFDDYIRPAARTLVRSYADRCLAEPEVFVSVVSSLLVDKPIFSASPDTGAFGTRLQQNTPAGVIQAPVFIGQGGADALVLPAVQSAYVHQRCALTGGGPLEYKTYPGRDHVGVVANDSPLIPDLVAWTKDRIAGRSATSTC